MTQAGRKFMEQTKYKNLGETDQALGVAQPPLELDYSGEKRLVALPDPEGLAGDAFSLRQAMENRRTVREFSPQPFSLAEVAYLLWCTQGIKEVTDRPSTLRMVPSAGARHCLETYLLVNNVQGLPNGIYRYIALKHKLLPFYLGSDAAEKVVHAANGQEFIKESALTFIWSAVAERMTWRYGERGYRYIHLDAGHVCQNLYLAAQSVGGGVCAIAAFDDDLINSVLGIDGEEQFVVYLAAAGKRLG